MMGTDEYYASWDVFGCVIERLMLREGPRRCQRFLAVDELRVPLPRVHVGRLLKADDDEFDHPHADPLTMHAQGQVGQVTFMDGEDHVLVDAHVVRVCSPRACVRAWREVQSQGGCAERGRAGRWAAVWLGK